MWRKKFNYLIFALLAVLVLIGVSSSSSDRVASNSPNVARAANDEILYYKKPSADPVKFAFVYWTSGFSQQPTSQYTYPGQAVTLNTKMAYTLAESLIPGRISNQWYDSRDGINWGPTNGETGENLTINSNEVGTRYYQQSTVKKSLLTGWVTLDSWYSKVASVTTYPEPKDATSVKVSVENDYLYNNLKEADTTFAHATPDPYDSTAKLSWSVDDPSIATIDANTGQITANTSGKSGTVKVTGTLTNSDESTVEDSVNVRVGGGLDDQTVNEGSTATFKIQGNFNGTPDSIVWHKIVNGKESTISGANDISYTTPATVYTDDKTQYYAVITVVQKDNEGNDQKTTITTNKATLNVIPDTNPRVILNSTLYNESYDDHNADNTELNNIIAGDKITIKGTADDENVNSKMAAGVIKIELPDNIEKDSDVNVVVHNVKIDGNATDDYYVITDPNDGNKHFLRLFNIDFSQNKSHAYEFSFNASGNDNNDFVTAPTLTGQDADENELDGTYEGNSLTMHFRDNKLNADAHDVDYGTLKYSNVGKVQSGTVNGQTTADILSITDNRRNKGAASIYLSQDTPFVDGDKKLASELRYYSADSQYQVLTDQNALVSSSDAGNSVPSVTNSPDVGLKLLLFNSVINNGNYSSTLTWTIQDTPN